MARFVYAKIYCDILRHPLLRGRPDCDVRLVLGLLLEAKEHTDNGVLRHLTAQDAKELCHIKAPTRTVQAGIDYLVTSGWLIPHPDQAYEIKDFVARQAADSAAERMSRHRDRVRDEPVTKRNAVVTLSSPDTEAEEEGEEEVKKQKPYTAPPVRVAKKPTSGPTWDAYSEAYRKRYGAEPVRNARVNTQLARFIACVGVEEAPAIAAFFVGHNSAYYVAKMHPVGALFLDAEKLRTEWATGKRVTATAAKQSDQTQANIDGWANLLSVEGRDALVAK